MSPRTRFGQCKACGAAIVWIQSANGKPMPANAKTERFYPDPHGKSLYILNDGHTMRGNPVPDDRDVMDPEPGVSSGHVSHFATCPQADNFRKR